MSQRVRVVCVKGINKAEERAKICYVGRAFAGWPATPWGNYGRRDCPNEFRSYLLKLPEDILSKLLDSLWESCEHGAKPLGCWCLEWDGTGPTPGCHAAVWAELLNERYLKEHQ